MISGMTSGIKDNWRLAIGVVTALAGRADRLARHLDGLLTSTVEPMVHVVVSQGKPEVLDVLENAANRHPEVGLRTELIELGDDGSGPPLAEARNMGAEAAIGAGADLLVFLDPDLIPDRSLLESFAKTAGDRPDALLCGAVTYLPPAPPGGYVLEDLPSLRAAHPARPALPPGQRQTTDHYHLFWSLSFASSADTWQTIGGFHEEYRGYGGEDTDFAMMATQEGMPLVWVGDAHAYHQQHHVASPPVAQLDWLLRNGAIFNQRWGVWPMEPLFRELHHSGLVCPDSQGGWTKA